MDHSLATQIGAAYSAHEAGQLTAAENMYRALLLAHPRQVDVLYLLSSLLMASRPGESLELAQQATLAAAGAGGLGVGGATLHDHYAACLRAAGASAQLEAEQLQHAQALEPGNVERLFRLAEARRRAGQGEAAAAVLVQYLAQRPDDFNARSNLGALLLQGHQLAAAIEQLQRVVSAAPGHLAARKNLGKALEETGREDLAVEQYRQAVGVDPGDLDSWVALADALHSLMRLDEAIVAYQSAERIDAQDWRVVRGLNSVYVKRVPRWHFAMMNDAPRNQAYDRALVRQIAARVARGEPPLVLDIGAGSGLLSMMAARAGASQVVACEMVTAVADMAREIVADNGLGDRIRVHGKKSTSLVVGTDLPRRADLLVTEIFDVGLLAEYVLPVLAHARQNLLIEGAQVIPAGATVWMMPVESTAIHQSAFVADENACGFGFERFNRFSRRIGYEQLVLKRFDYTALAEPSAVMSFDFSHDVPDREGILSFTPTRSGQLHAWVFWFALQLDADTVFDSGPFNQGSHWAQAVQIEPQPPTIQRGQAVSVKFSQSQTHIRFIYPAE